VPVSPTHGYGVYFWHVKIANPRIGLGEMPMPSAAGMLHKYNVSAYVDYSKEYRVMTGYIPWPFWFDCFKPMAQAFEDCLSAQRRCKGIRSYSTVEKHLAGRSVPAEEPLGHLPHVCCFLTSGTQHSSERRVSAHSCNKCSCCPFICHPISRLHGFR
jgi:hypothetical protein